VVITNGDNDSFPLWYAQAVEGVRPDVTITVVPYLGTEWYAHQLQKRRVVEYDAATGPALYRDKTWAKPTTQLFPLTTAEIDAIPPIVALPQPQRFVHDGMDVTINAQYLTRDQQLVLYMIKHAYPERPIFFSYGGYASALALLRHPDAFHAASASSSVTSWHHYDTIYTERYMYTPQANPEGYKKGNAMEYAANLRGRLMIFYGTADDNVHPNNSMQLIQALQRAGKSFEVQVGPDVGHASINQQRMMEFFIQSLVLER
jgi:hypothetical protein